MEEIEEIDLQQPNAVDRKTYATHAIQDIRKQKQTIERLKKENQHIKDLISSLSDRNNNKRPITASSTRENRVYTIKEMITQERTELQKLEDQAAALKRRAWSKKAPELGGPLEKQLKILENRLDKGTQKLNEAVAQNKELRDIIDNLRRERAVFDSLYNKLEKELHEKRKEMADIIEKANYSYEQRDKANQQIQNIKDQARKETFDFDRELKELSLLTEKSRIGNYSAISKRPQSTQPNVERPRSAKKKDSVVNLKRLEKLRDDFKKIETGTQILNFSDLIQIFTQNEEKNFKSFKFLNEQANEIDELEEQLQNLQKELNDFSKGDTPPDRRFEQTTLKLEMAEQRQADISSQHKQTSKNMASLISNVEKMLSCVMPEKSSALKSTGATNISETTVMAFLEMIEQRAIRLCKLHKEVVKPQEKDSGFSIADLKNQSKKDAFVFDDFDDDDEEYDKILSHDDFRKKANQKLAAQHNDRQRKEEKHKRR